MKTETLAVPGATLHYEVRGSGPVLLLICGGIYDAEGFAGLAEELAATRTVVTYDRRGNSRSPLAGPPGAQRVEEHAEDAHRLLTAVGVTAAEPAEVFGNSSGATIALELVARHPELVRAVVAHEPPIFDLLPDAERFRELMRQIDETLRQAGWGAAMGVFGAGMGMAQEQGQGAPPSPEFAARMQRNVEFFASYEIVPVSSFRLDVDAVRASGVRVVPGAGAASEGEPPNRVAVELAALLGTEVAVFPGGHGGFGNAKPFAEKLREVL